MGPLHKQAWGTLLRMRWTMVGLALLVAIVTLLAAGGVRTASMLRHSRSHWLDALGSADLEIRFDPLARGVADALKDPDVVAADERLLAAGVMRVGDSMRWTAAAIQMIPTEGPAPRVNRFHLLRGRMPRPDEPAAVVDRSVCKSFGVDIGTSISVRAADMERTVPVVGVALSSEHLITPIHPQYSLPLQGTLAILAVSEAAIAGEDVDTKRCNSLVIRIRPGADPRTVASRLMTRSELSAGNVLVREEQPSFALSKMLIRVFDIYMPTIAFILVLLATSILAFTLTQIVRRQRRQLGTQRALGYRVIDIARSFLPFALVPVLAGFAVGTSIHGACARHFYRAYADSMGYVPLRDPGVGWSLAALFFGYITIAVIACAVSAYFMAREAPAHLLRGDAAEPSPGSERAFLAPLRRWLRPPSSVLMGLSHVVRHRWTSLTTMLVLAGVLTVILAFLLVHVTHVREIDAGVARMGLDATVQFKDPVALEDLTPNPASDAMRIEPQITRTALLRTGGEERFRRVVGATANAWVAQLKMARGRRLTTADEHVIMIDHWIADEQNVRIGDTIELAAGKNTPDVISCKVIGVMEGVSVGLAVVPLEVMRTLFYLPDLLTDAQVAAPLDESELQCALWSLPQVETVHTMASARSAVAKNFQGGEKILITALLLSILLAAVYLAVIALLDAADRGQDLAVLRAIGWRPRSLFAVCVTEVMARGLGAVVLALPLAPVLARWLLRQIAKANHYHMELYCPWWVPLTVVSLALLVMPLGALPAFRSATRVSPARALRNPTE